MPIAKNFDSAWNNRWGFKFYCISVILLHSLVQYKVTFGQIPWLLVIAPLVLIVFVGIYESLLHTTIKLPAKVGTLVGAIFIITYNYCELTGFYYKVTLTTITLASLFVFGSLHHEAVMEDFRHALLSSWFIASCTFGVLLFLFFLALKLDDCIDWDFWTVFTPIWINNYFFFAFTITVLISPTSFLQYWRFGTEDKKFFVALNIPVLMYMMGLELWVCNYWNGGESVIPLTVFVPTAAIITIGWYALVVSLS
jgi:hypothetical protein